MTSSQTHSYLRQPRAVWAVAFACVIAFMGIGLVDPILKDIAAQLEASPSQVSLMFSGYMAVMGVAMLVYVVVRSRGFDPWLRLVGAAALAQHAVALFYAATPRYHFLTWFLTLLVCAAFMQQVGLPWLQRRYPEAAGRLRRILWPPRLAAVIGWLDGKAN